MKKLMSVLVAFGFVVGSMMVIAGSSYANCTKAKTEIECKKDTKCTWDLKANKCNNAQKAPAAKKAGKATAKKPTGKPGAKPETKPEAKPTTPTEQKPANAAKEGEPELGD